jgi:hypothetical protein
MSVVSPHPALSLLLKMPRKCSMRDKKSLLFEKHYFISKQENKRIDLG